MTFINPAILWGLAAVSIPIIIHIFNLKRTKKIEFSTLMFLKEIQQSKYKKLKLKQFLILLCRIAFISFLVFAFSRPFEKGYLFSSGHRAQSSVLLVLDDSFSMLSREIQRSNFDAAKNRLTELIALFDENDEVFFTTVSEINTPGRNFLAKDLGSLADSIKNLKVSDVSRDLNSVIYYSSRILSSASYPHKEIFLFTDGQKSFVEGGTNTETPVLPENTKLNIILSGTRRGSNLSVDSAVIATQIFEKNKPVRIKCSVTNHNTFNVVNKSVVLSLGPKAIRDEKSIDIPANSTLSVEFNVLIGATGFISGSIELLQKEIADDEIPNDNKQFISFFIPKQINILMVSDSPNDLNYLKLALSSSEELMKDSSGSKTKYYSVKQAGIGDISIEDLSKYNCVVIVNAGDISADASAKLASYINSGGGVLLFPGSKTTAGSYSGTLFRELDVPSFTGKLTPSQPLKFEDIDLSHPVFDGIFSSKEGVRDNILKNSPSVTSAIDLPAGKNSRALITLTGGKNFVVEHSQGKGKLLIYAVSPDLNGSDFAMKSLFSPLVIRSILYMSPETQLKPATTGKDYYFEIAGKDSKDTLKPIVLLPGGKQVTLIVGKENSMYNLKYQLSQNGIYRIDLPNEPAKFFASNFDRRESLTDKFNSKELASIIKSKNRLEANIINPESNVTAAISVIRNGREIWQYLLVIALLMLAAEFFIARSIKT